MKSSPIKIYAPKGASGWTMAAVVRSELRARDTLLAVFETALAGQESSESRVRMAVRSVGYVIAQEPS